MMRPTHDYETASAQPAQCPACGAKRFSQVGRKGPLTILECSACGLQYSHPQPLELIDRRYTEEYDLAAHFERLSERKRVLYERRLQRIGQPLLGHSRLFDVGCGDGQFLALAASEGWEPHGIDMNPPAVKRGRQRGAHVLEGKFETTTDLEWGAFDLVTSWDSLEHSSQPYIFAERLTRLLAPDGILALTTLNRKALVARVLGMRWSMIVPDHFTFWDRSSLERLFRGLGLDIVSCTSFGLGRDLVSLVDRLASWTRRMRPPTAVGQLAPSNAVPRWDTRRRVLAAEDLLNRALDMTQAGVGIELVMRRSA